MKDVKFRLIGDVIRELRVNSHLSIQDLSDEFEVSGTYLSRIENNKKYPSEKFIRKVSLFFDIPVDELKMYDYRFPRKNLTNLCYNNPEYGFFFQMLVDDCIETGKRPLDVVKEWLKH